MRYIENKQMVLPGSLLADNNYECGRYTFEEDNKIFSNTTGLVYFNSETISVIPFKYTYDPCYGDLVIGKVIATTHTSWTVDINSSYNGFLLTSDIYDKNEQSINDIININDMLLLRVGNVDEIRRVRLTIRSHGLGKFNQGVIIRVKQPTVHFLSEENAFLTNMIQEYTHTGMIVAKNGLIWLNGHKNSVEKVISMIDLIEKEPLKYNLIKDVQSILMKFQIE